VIEASVWFSGWIGALLGFQRLMQAFGEAAARHHAAGELVDDDHLAIADDVVLVALEQLVRAQRLVDVVDEETFSVS
jgi:NAD(P)H-hydrate repair Nnr-like enzyme with NAD(P)H-hydrate dehydratase domain